MLDAATARYKQMAAKATTTKTQTKSLIDSSRVAVKSSLIDQVIVFLLGGTFPKGLNQKIYKTCTRMMPISYRDISLFICCFCGYQLRCLSNEYNLPDILHHLSVLFSGLDE